MMKIVKFSYLALLIGLVLLLVHFESSILSVISLVGGLLIVALVGEPMVEGLKEFGVCYGFSDHVTGIISSLASNLPEAVMTLFMVICPPI